MISLNVQEIKKKKILTKEDEDSFLSSSLNYYLCSTLSKDG